jgi:hypothetical protein
MAALALGTAAVGVLALGAVAVGRLAVGGLTVRRARFHSVEIEDLTVRRLRVIETMPEITDRPDGSGRASIDDRTAPAAAECQP